jgi:hypothetical protein
MPTRKQINRGFYGFKTDEAEFLKPSNTDPYVAEASGAGYNSTKDDDRGFERGALGFTDDDKDFRRPSFTGDTDYVHGALYGLIDGQEDLGSGNKLTGGGGPVSDNKYGGVGSGKAPASRSPGHRGQTVRGSRGGVTNVGRRGR